MTRGKKGSGKHDTEMRELREGVGALSNVTARMLVERDNEIARLNAEVTRYRNALAIIAGSQDRLQAAQAICALDNIGPDVGNESSG